MKRSSSLFSIGVAGFLALVPAAARAQFILATNNGTITIIKYRGSGGDVVIPRWTNGLPVTRIGDAAFQYRGSLANVTLPDGITAIGDYAFRNCTNLTSVTIPDGVASIGQRSFNQCTSLKNVMIAGSVTNIGLQAFGNCTSLTGIYFKGNAPSLGHSYVSHEDTNTTVYYLPGTTGWGSTFGGRPTALWNPQAQSSRARAIALALRVSGLKPQVDQLQITAIPEAEAASSQANSTSNSYSDSDIGLWHVTFTNVRLSVEGPRSSAFVNPKITQLDVIVDATTGRVLRIYSPLPDGQRVNSPLDAVGKTVIAGDSPAWRIEGLATTLVPAMNFYEALQHAADQGKYYFLKGPQIDAFCADLRNMESGALTVAWVITSRRLPPSATIAGGRRPEYFSGPTFMHARVAIDVFSGTALTSVASSDLNDL